MCYKLLPMESFEAADVSEGLHAVAITERKAGVTRAAAQNGISALLSLPDSLRGAMIFVTVSGKRLDRTRPARCARKQNGLR